MILLAALVAGLGAGLGWAYLRRQAYRPPEVRYMWLILVAFLPQFFTIYLPSTRERSPDWLAAASLVSSQAMLLGFAWLNRRLPGMPSLIAGAILNMTVITANGGFMPISPATASRLVPQNILEDVSPGSRFGIKDILLPPEETRFEWLADRFLPPAWFPYQVAFSLGDVLIALGIFWLLASQRTPTP